MRDHDVTPAPVGVLGTVAFLAEGEYHGLEVRAGDDGRSVTLYGVATSFVHSRPVRLVLDGDLVERALRSGPRLSGALGRVWETDGSIDGLAAFPVLECEPVPVPGGDGGSASGAVVRVMSEYGEQRCVYVTGCPDGRCVAALVACAVTALALPAAAWQAPDGSAGSAPVAAHVRFAPVDGGATPWLAGDVLATAPAPAGVPAG